MNGRVKILIGIIVLIIIVGAGAAWYFFLYQAPLPADLQNATYISFDQNGQTIAYKRTSGTFGATFTQVSVPQTAVSIAPAKTGYATITENNNAFSIEVNGHQLLAPTTTPANIAISPNGRWVGLSLSKTFATTTLPATTERTIGMGDPSWVAGLIDTSAKTLSIQSLDLGFSPVFTDATHVAWISPRGLNGMNLSTGNQTLLAPLARQSAFGPLHTSPDGKYVAFLDIQKNTIDIYSVTSTTATVVSQLPVDKKNSPISYALGTSTLYSLYVTKSGTQILSTPFTGGASKTIETIPATYHVVRILIPSSL